RTSLGLPPDDLLLINVGRMVPVKNQRFLISVLHHLQAYHPSCLILIGDGPLWHELAALARQHGLTNRVIMPGHQTATQIAKYLHASDVFALPSNSEGLGLAA